MKKSGSGESRRERLRLLREAALHRKVLAKLPTGFEGRWTRRHWLHASLFASLGALVAAIVPGFTDAMQEHRPTSHTSMALALPQLALGRHHISDDNWQTVQLRPGQTLSEVFSELGIPYSQLERVMQHPKIKPALRRMRPGTELAFNLPRDGSVRAMTITIDDQPMELEFTGTALRERMIPQEVTTRTVVLSGNVGKSLFASARKVGLGRKQLAQLTDEMFKYDIDFDSDLDEDDRFSVVVDQTWKNGQLSDTGPVLAAAFTVDSKLKSAFRHVRDGKPGYYTAEGRPLQRAFIRMPIPYARLTSRFGARRHPVLGSMRMHKGVDYGASTGTPIMAAGDARVQFVGRKGGYGNTVILDHGRGYTTLYGHMSSFAKIRRGQRIAQGTVIGRVGSTGLATGPHLHYEFRVNGVHRNPLSMTMPPPQPLSGAALVAFKNETRRALDKIREVEDVIYYPGEDTQVAKTETKKPPRKG
ncbi:murein DD-endopeptidase MepM/ murein hydrolase activator NlpD [Luteimonas cucumeris]|uniref:Murein DD-endopeptidase MepM/ murein hydrolase activator NlpD n=1 Tax=Luteimonas cucumeris TaxID=985012 RepID=A0A562LDU8_9GAMM|nr:M23 family metallopeptidase [Luteimonas cucumeris]TWI05852.1 murein DD-endopeptidase MepM/ murein hydrolase activator NlpD [Luteimonas cucumeris]